ncbi:MAG: bifunctional DNA-formamidopyrimidine glycosylase/DNA-(apurinic or apyrimidinic site) lyase [Alphaproteobacteria bacterium]|nr:bifunctional DNA-formamidopyrimidine glycosylase/DNA-(apurinic or apyrimidinic site) lyase [Alphaproteobacteria bacterium]
MPELPEVETVCRGLQSNVLGRHIDDVIIRRDKIRIPIPCDFAESCQGAKIERIERRAKYILIHLDNGYCILVHLGMSGRMQIFSRLPTSPQKHDHVDFLLSDGQLIVFNDPRRFGVITGAPSETIMLHTLLNHLGPEPMSESFNAAYLYDQLKKRKQSIKPVLMDQKLVVGVGNIYVCEALFKTRINPERAANKINKKECERLVEAIKVVLQDAIASGGSTLRDYVDSAGKAGYFQHNFAVYDREGKLCTGCSAPITRMTQAGRSTYWCENCQK